MELDILPGSPLDLEIGDTVTFSATGGPGSVTVNGLAIFTDNSNVVLTNGTTDATYSSIWRNYCR